MVSSTPYREAEADDVLPLTNQDIAKLKESRDKAEPVIIGTAAALYIWFVASLLGAFLSGIGPQAVTAIMLIPIAAMTTWGAHKIRRHNRRIKDDLRENKKRVFLGEVTGKEETNKNFQLLAGAHMLQSGVEDYLKAKVGHTCEIHLAPRSEVVLQWRLLPGAD